MGQAVAASGAVGASHDDGTAGLTLLLGSGREFKSNTQAEEEIAEMVKEFRRSKEKHG